MKLNPPPAFIRPGRRLHRRTAIAAAAATALALTACSGGDDGAAPTEPAVVPTVAFSGVVADGPLQGAVVCYDLNDNAACDSGEPAATTDADGRYAFQVGTAEAGRHAVVAAVPATAIDKDTGAAVGVAFTLRAPASNSSAAQQVFVSPLTTVVSTIAQDTGRTVAEAADQVKASLNLAVSPLANFVGGDAGAALAARALGAVLIQTTRLAGAAGVGTAQTAVLLRTASTSQLDVVAGALAAGAADTPAARVTAAVAAVNEALNLSAGTVQAVATQLALPAGPADTPGPFVSLRRFAYTDASNYSYTVFHGDSSQTDSAGAYAVNEVRVARSAGADAPFNRNQAYWTGSAWQVCALDWQVARTRASTATAPSASTYCGASRSEARVTQEDIAGKTLREVVARLRASPLADSVGAHTDPISGLPVNWGPRPELLPADAVFPAGSRLSSRQVQGDLGGTDRIELTTKSTVRWADGVFRQATTLEQYGSMQGNLADAATAATGSNTVYVADVPLAAQPDAALEAFKRWRAGFDIPGLKARFYRCDVRKTDQSSLNCAAAGDATLAIATQGGVRLLKFASGYPAALTALEQQRFWAEYGGGVFRGLRDLPRTRFEQRLNGPAWAALRTALNIPAHTDAVAPAASGPFKILRSFSFTNAANYSWRSFEGDSSLLDGSGNYIANERRKTVASGADVPFARNRLYWTGSEWYDCPSSGDGVNIVASTAPFRSAFCKGYVDDRAANVVLTLGGRLMSDVINDIRAYGSTDFGDAYNDWGPTPSAYPQLASTRFPVGATMEYRGNQRVATPIAISTAAADQLRVAPSPTSTAAFSTWPFATSLEQVITAYSGSLVGSTLSGNTTLFVRSITETPSNAAYTNQVEIRVAFDAAGNKARFTRNNRLVSNGNSTNYTTLLDTTYTVETLGDARVLKFAALPAGFEDQFLYQVMLAQKTGAVRYAFKDTVAAKPDWSIRLNGPAFDALRTALGIN